jgi:ribonuclease HI
MAKQKKYYVVWSGQQTGIFETWEECKQATHGVAGAKYKSFGTRREAETALTQPFTDHIQARARKKSSEKKKIQAGEAISGLEWNSIAVDAAASGNPGPLEYRGVETETGLELFRQGPFAEGTNNVGEFLALVHGLSYLKQRNDPRPIYSDSTVAIGWIRQKKCKSKLAPTLNNQKLFELIQRAEKWLANNTCKNRILKWETKDWGEIPADFGRK